MNTTTNFQANINEISYQSTNTQTQIGKKVPTTCNYDAISVTEKNSRYTIEDITKENIPQFYLTKEFLEI